MLETIIVAICFIIVIGVTGFALLYFRDNGTEEPQKTGKKTNDKKGEQKL